MALVKTSANAPMPDILSAPEIPVRRPKPRPMAKPEPALPVKSLRRYCPEMDADGIRVWERRDLVNHHQPTHPSGPTWGEVLNRITYDLEAEVLLQDLDMSEAEPHELEAPPAGGSIAQPP